MENRKIVIQHFISGIIILIMMITSATTFGGPANIHGFRLIGKKFVKEINAEVYYFEHVKSGARLVKIAANDENKTFSIAFKTFPVSDNGAPHIMEHSVLNGSRNFPVKSPFDVLQKGSLSTFMNAFTSKDFTMFPVASMNDKDYFNLMHVYLDAVFNPLLYTDNRILKQEGWHYELEDKAAPVIYKGVVYNEMKGAYSNPQRELYYQTYKNLFPDNPYGFESGGHPAAIPTLTQKDFINYHRKYYDPENSYIFLYGNADMDKELEFIDRLYLSGYTKSGNKATIEDQKPFAAQKEITAYYPVLEGAETKDQTYLTMALVAGHNTDQALNMSLDILCEVLVNQESAPLRIALQKAGIGQDVSASVSNYKQNVVQITIQNANPSDQEKFRMIADSVFSDAIRKGINKQEVEGILNRLEFQLREGNDAQKGMTYINQILPGWFFADDPYLGLEYEAPLAEVKTALTSNYLENILKKYLLNNPHTLFLALEPKPGLDKQNSLITEAQLKQFKTNLSQSEKDSLISQTHDLVEYQKREDTPKALETIPLLDISDISPKSEWYIAEEKNVSGIPLLFHEEFTNDVVYMNLFFDLHAIAEEQIPYASLLSNLLGMLNTEKYNYGELNQELNIATGGFMTSINTFLENQDDNNLIAKFKISSKAMNPKVPKLIELTGEILNKTQFTDQERLKSLLTRHLSQLEANIRRDGYGVANSRVSSYYSHQGMFNESVTGLDYFWFISRLVRDFDQDAGQIMAMLKKTSEMIFKKENLIASVTCGKNDLEKFSADFQKMANALPAGKTIMNDWKIEPVKRNEGILTSSKVQYVIEGSDYKKLGYKWNGKMRVLSQVLSTDWLQNQIRVIGGAYGGWSSFGISGIVTFNSYRDPNLSETLDNYKRTPDYLLAFNADPKTMTRYIIGTISSLDKPLTASQRGEQAFTYYFAKRKKEDIQAERNAILSTTSEDIRGFSKMVKDILDQNTYCVYGNADKITSEKNIFTNLIKIEK